MAEDQIDKIVDALVKADESIMTALDPIAFEKGSREEYIALVRREIQRLQFEVNSVNESLHYWKRALSDAIIEKEQHESMKRALEEEGPWRGYVDPD